MRGNRDGNWEDVVFSEKAIFLIGACDKCYKLGKIEEFSKESLYYKNTLSHLFKTHNFFIFP